MNVGVFASDAKGVSILNSLVNELHNSDINYFAMLCQNTHLSTPGYPKAEFTHLTNIDNIEESEEILTKKSYEMEA